MAEKIVNNTETNKRINKLESGIEAILSHLGIGDEAEKTSARVSARGNRPAMARKSKGGEDDVVITLTDAMIEGRMKLPARMFTKGPKVVVDGHTFTQQPHDQNRSTKFNPEIFGYDVEAGDEITFRHVQGREWEVAQVAEGSAPKRKPAKKAAKPVARKAEKPSKGQSKPSSGKVKRTESNTSSIGAKIQEFAELCIENANDDDFEENENIKQTGSFDLDARVLFTTSQNQKFRSWRKSQGLTLKKAVSLLNAAVYE